MPDFTPVIKKDEIEQQISRIAAVISRDYQDRELVLIGVLKGAFIFLADLCRRLTIPHRVDFIALSSYGQTAQSSGVVRMIMDLKINMEERHVLVVEDIVDSGYTLDYLLRNFATRRPARLRAWTMARYS